MWSSRAEKAKATPTQARSCIIATGLDTRSTSLTASATTTDVTSRAVGQAIVDQDVEAVLTGDR